MSELAVRAQLVRLSRLLNVPPDALSDLEGQDAATLARVRKQLSSALFDEHRKLFAKLAQANKLLPLGVTAKMTTAVIGPTLAGRVASEMDPARAVALAGKLPVEFLAETCMAMDPQRAEPVVRAMPTKIVVGVSRALCAKRDFMTAATFVNVLDDAVIQAVMADNDDDADLLQIGFFIEDKTRLEALMAMMDDARIANTMVTAEREGLWAQALAMMEGTSLETRARVGTLVAEHDDALLAQLFAAASEHGQWPLLLAAVPALPPAAQQRYKSLSPDWDAAGLDDMRDTIAAQGGDFEAVRAALLA